MTKPLEPEIKVLRAMGRVLDALPDDPVARRRIMEWAVARALNRPGFSIPRRRGEA